MRACIYIYIYIERERERETEREASCDQGCAGPPAVLYMTICLSIRFVVRLTILSICVSFQDLKVNSMTLGHLAAKAAQSHLLPNSVREYE